MKPDVKIVIAWSGDYQYKIAETLCNKLTAYSKKGYPVNASMISPKSIAENDTLYISHFKDEQNEAIRTIKSMHSSFSDFDVAFFLFDTIGKACTFENANSGEKKCTDLPPLLSASLFYEYGLASSLFINRSKEKDIFCFSPSKTKTNELKDNLKDRLKYIDAIDFIEYDSIPNVNKINIDDENQRDFITAHIIEHLIHKELLKPRFYGLPDLLPPLEKNNKNEYAVKGNLSIDSLMDLENNTYWANLKELKPSRINISLHEQDEALNQLFEKEYKRFDDSKDNDPNHILGRRLLYIVDRAVFIMYLRKEDDWDKKVKELYETRVKILRNEIPKISQAEIKKDYYIKSIKALQGVFMYQKCRRPKEEGKPLSGKLSENLDKIEKLLRPISQVTDKKGNRMIYCMATDYLALVYHKKATKKLGEIIGKGEYYLDNSEHYDLLVQKIEEYQSNNKELTDLIKETIDLFFKAASLFKKVVDCETLLQDIVYNNECTKKYIWTSYALYNQARCEFAIHLILNLYKHITGNVFADVDIKISNLGELWQEDMRNAVISRKTDYLDFKKQEDFPNFPRFIIFNMQAEYYHALYEYELSCIIEKQFNQKFKDIEEDVTSSENFQTWKKNNLTISDVLDVDDKVKRIEKLKTDYVNKEIRNLINELVKDKKQRDDIYDKLKDFSPEIVNAILSTDISKVEETKKKFWDKISAEVSIDVGVSEKQGWFTKLGGVLKKR